MPPHKRIQQWQTRAWIAFAILLLIALLGSLCAWITELFLGPDAHLSRYLAGSRHLYKIGSLIVVASIYVGCLYSTFANDPEDPPTFWTDVLSLIITLTLLAFGALVLIDAVWLYTEGLTQIQSGLRLISDWAYVFAESTPIALPILVGAAICFPNFGYTRNVNADWNVF